MLSCWNENPEMRPCFSTLQHDLDEFEYLSEHKYAYASETYMKENNMTNTVPEEKKQVQRRPKRIQRKAK